MNKRAESIFAGFVLFYALFFVVGAFTYREDVRTVPLIVGIPTLLLAVALVITSFRKGSTEKTSDNTQVEAAPLKSDDKSMFGKRELTFITWFAGYVAAIYLFGLLIATPLFLLSYFFFCMREGVIKSLIAGVIGWVTLYFIFDRAMGVVFEPGILLKLFL